MSNHSSSDNQLPESVDDQAHDEVLVQSLENKEKDESTYEYACEHTYGKLRKLTRRMHNWWIHVLGHDGTHNITPEYAYLEQRATETEQRISNLEASVRVLELGVFGKSYQSEKETNA